jgi:hypothetical protein
MSLRTTASAYAFVTKLNLTQRNPTQQIVLTSDVHWFAWYKWRITGRKLMKFYTDVMPYYSSQSTYFAKLSWQEPNFARWDYDVAVKHASLRVRCFSSIAIR